MVAVPVNVIVTILFDSELLQLVPGVVSPFVAIVRFCAITEQEKATRIKVARLRIMLLRIVI